VPSIILTYYSTEPIKTLINDRANFLGRWLDDHVLAGYAYTIIVMILQGIILPILQHLAEKLEPASNIKDLLILRRAIELIVKAKKDRFSDAFRRLCNNEIKNEQVFLNITKPEQQIAVIAEQLCITFEQLTLENVPRRKKSHIKVRILSVIDGNIDEDYYAIAPQDCIPVTPISELRHSDSTVSVCLKYKRMVFISDITEELKKTDRRYRPTHQGITDDQDGDKGCLICYPVIQDNKIIFIVCLSSCVDGLLTPKLKEFYKEILDQFASRITLEHRLLQLKGQAK